MADVFCLGYRPSLGDNMVSVEQSIEQTAKRYGERVSRLAPDPDDLAKCPICKNDFIVAEIFPNAKSRPDIADSVEASFKLQMTDIVSQVQKEVIAMHEEMSVLTGTIQGMRNEQIEMKEERDAATEKFLDMAPRLSCLKQILASVKKAKLNISALMQSFRPKDADMEEHFEILQNVATLQGDTLDEIHNLIIDAFADND